MVPLLEATRGCEGALPLDLIGRLEPLQRTSMVGMILSCRGSGLAQVLLQPQSPKGAMDYSAIRAAKVGVEDRWMSSLENGRQQLELRSLWLKPFRAIAHMADSSTISSL